MDARRRRDAVEIKYAILKAGVNGQKKTRIMYQSSLNMKQLNLHLEELVLNDLISYQPTGRYFTTTERGKAFTKMFENYRETSDLLTEQERALERFLTSRSKKPLGVAA